MAKKESDNPRASDPTLNDDSQPSVVNTYQVLKAAAENAGTPLADAGIPVPADVLDARFREALADESAEEMGAALAEAVKEDANVEAGGEPKKAGAKK